jgi:hypothetical protein
MGAVDEVECDGVQMSKFLLYLDLRMRSRQERRIRLVHIRTMTFCKELVN